MKNPVLFAFLALALCGPLRAQPRVESSAVAATRETLRRLNAAPDAGQNRALLQTLRSQLESLHSLPDFRTSPALRRLQEAELKLWRSVPDNSSQPLPPGAGEDLKNVRSAFDVAFPEPSVSGSRSVSGTRGPTQSVEADEARLTARMSAARARTTGAISDPNRYFDGHVVSNGAGVGPGKNTGPATGGGAHDAPYKLSTVAPKSDLRHAPIPSPAAVAPPQQKGFFSRAYDGLRDFTVNTALPAAKTSASIALLLNPATAPFVLAPAVVSVAEAYRRDNAATAVNVAGCTRAVQGTPFLASEVANVCRSSPAMAPILAGLIDSVKQQFGTVGGIVSTVISLVLGILVGALTGGIGLVVKALVAIGMTVYAAWELIKSLTAAMDQYAASRDGSPERYDAIRKIGVVGGGLLLMGVLALLGVGAGKLAAGTRAGAATNAAASALVEKLGIRGLMASVEAKIPWLAKLAPAGEEKAPPSGQSEISGNRSRIKAPEPPKAGEPVAEPAVTAGELGLQRTRPSLPPDEAAFPKGKPKRISPRETDAANINATNGENSAAKTLARKGYDVEQLQEVKGRSANPDYKIEGELFDCYTPQERTPVRNILDTIRGKVPRQAERIVLNMDYAKDPDALISALQQALKENPIPKLKEIIVVRGGHVIHL